MKIQMIALVCLSLIASAPSFAMNLKYSCSNKKDRMILSMLPGNRLEVQIPAASAKADFDMRGEFSVDSTYSSNTGSQYVGGLGAYGLKPGVMLPQMMIMYSIIVPTNMINGTPGENGLMGGTILVRENGSPALKYKKLQCGAIAN